MSMYHFPFQIGDNWGRPTCVFNTLEVWWMTVLGVSLHLDLFGPIPAVNH